jgi:hypothetical protein
MPLELSPPDRKQALATIPAFACWPKGSSVRRK